MKNTLYIFILLFFVISTNYSQNDTVILKNSILSINTLIDNGNYEIAKQKADSAFLFASKINNTFYIAEAYNIKGIINRDQSNLKEALDNYLSALQLFEKLKLPIRVAGMQNNLGLIYAEIKEYRTALAYYFKAVAINKKFNRLEFLGINYNNIGTCYQHLKQYSSSQNYLNKSLTIRMQINDTIGIAMAYHNIGINFQLNSIQDTAIAYFNKSLALLGTDNENIGHAYNYLELGNTYLQLNKLNEAEAYLMKSLALSKKNNLEGIKVEVYNYLSQIFIKKHDYKNAYEYQNLYLASKQTIEGDENKNEILKKELEYDFNKRQELQRIEGEKRQAIADAEIKSQKKLTTYAIIALFILSGLIVFVFRSYRQKKKANFIISKQKEIVEHKQKEIVDSINYAKYIQNALLPSSAIISQLQIDCFILFKPKDIVSGDFYWVHQSKDKGAKLFIAAADCTGHGVPGALVSVLGNNGLNQCVKEFHITDTGKILDKLSELVEDTFDKSENELKDGMDISLCSISKLNDTILVEWSGANNPLWILKKNDNAIEEIKANKQPVGKFSDKKQFISHQFQLQKGDRIYLFTDGYADQFGGEKGKKFKYKQLEDILISTKYNTLAEQKNMLDTRFNQWKGELEQVDDICIIGIEV